MPTHVKKIGKNYCVVDASGKTKGRKGRCFASKKKANAVNSAINISLIRQGKVKPKGGTPAIALKPPPKRKKRRKR